MRIFTLLAIAILVPFTDATAFADHHLSADKDAILKIEKEWANAMVDGDGAWFKKTLTDDFKIVLPEGQVWTRDQFVNAWTTGAIDCTKCDNLKLDVRILGDTAIVIGQGDVAGIADGKEFAHTEKWTDVYMKKDNAWKCVSCHVCKVKE